MLISLRSQEAASENNFDDEEDDSVCWIFAIEIKISKKIRFSKFPNPENQIPMLKSNQIKACSSNCIFEVMFQLSNRFGRQIKTVTTYQQTLQPGFHDLGRF